MEQSYKKNRNSQKGKTGRGRNTSPKPGKAKGRRKGKEKPQVISGFSTLSQVSGAPLTKPYHSSIPVLPPRTVIEPFERCVICGEKIDGIASAFSLPNGYAHFDCVLERLKQSEHLEENETISYVGSGSFGVCRKDNEGKYTIVRKMDVESKENFQNFKTYVESLKE